jgi:hypothetical protein
VIIYFHGAIEAGIASGQNPTVGVLDDFSHISEKKLQ